MSSRKPLVIDLTDGRTKQLPDGDTLVVGVAVTTSSGDLSLNPVGTNITVAAGKVLGTTGTGNIDLPNNASAKFKIEGVAITSLLVTAPNLDTLCNGSDATALHTHSTGNVVAAVAGESLPVVGSQLGFENVTGSPRAFLAAAANAGNRRRSVGVNLAIAAAAGAAVSIITAGAELAIPDSQWDALPAVTDVGAIAYLSKTAGKAALSVAAFVAGDSVQQVGIITRGATNAVKLLIQPLGEVVL